MPASTRRATVRPPRFLLSLLLGLVVAFPALAETVILQSRLSGDYLAFNRQNLLAAIARGPQAQPFELIRLQGNRVAFRDPASGRFLRAGVGRDTNLALGEAHIRDWEVFELIRLGGGDVHIISVRTGNYVGYDGFAPLHARWGGAGAGQTFRMAPVSMPPAAPRAPAGAHPPPLEEIVTPRNIAEFVGTWMIEEIRGLMGQQLDLNADIMREARITFERDGSYVGNTSCNNINGQIGQQGEQLLLVSSVTTRIQCDEARTQVDRGIQDALRMIGSIRSIGGGRLELRDRNGWLRLVLVSPI